MIAKDVTDAIGRRDRVFGRGRLLDTGNLLARAWETTQQRVVTSELGSCSIDKVGLFLPLRRGKR